MVLPIAGCATMTCGDLLTALSNCMLKKARCAAASSPVPRLMSWPPSYMTSPLLATPYAGPYSRDAAGPSESTGVTVVVSG